MLLRPAEIAFVLLLILGLLGLKHVPALSFLPLSAITGIVAFSFAIFLALGLYRSELARIRDQEP